MDPTSLFRFATPMEYVLAVAAAGSCCAVPLMILLVVVAGLRN